MTLTKAASAIGAIAVLLTGSTLATTADAQSWRRGHDRGGWNRSSDWNPHHRNRGSDVAAAAVIAGVAGLVIGSALAAGDDRAPEPYYEQPPEDPCAYQDCSAQYPDYDAADADDGYAGGEPVYAEDDGAK